jgi:EAL domain-containing protein (putative c-di-GMP-specific phosphodiesterase class I)
MYRFWGQLKFQLGDDRLEPIGYEMFLRKKIGGEWVLPHSFNEIGVDDFVDCLEATMDAMPSSVKHVSVNLEQGHFVNEVYFQRLRRLTGRFNFHFAVELVERKDPNVTNEQLRKFARRYYESGIGVCIDDVGTGANDMCLVEQLNPYVEEYKFAIQNVRNQKNIEQIKKDVSLWEQRAHQNDKFFALEGIEKKHELAVVLQEIPCDILQGFYFSKPEILPVSFAQLIK